MEKHENITEQFETQTFRNTYNEVVREFSVNTQILGTILVKVTKSNVGWTAVEENYDGNEDHIRIWHSFKGEQDAVNNLVENMENHELEKR
jgi:hypothetical protein